MKTATHHVVAGSGFRTGNALLAFFYLFRKSRVNLISRKKIEKEVEEINL